MPNYSAMSFFLSCGAEAALDALEEQRIKEAKAILQQALDDANKLDRGHNSYGDFLEAVLPYTEEEIDALRGKIPMTQKIFDGVMKGARWWDYANVQQEMATRYPEFMENYDNRVGYPHEEWGDI